MMYGPDHAAAAVANHALSRESWARQRLAVHAGRTFTVVSGPFVTALRIDPTGLLEPHALADGAPDLRLAVMPWSLPGLMADPGRWDHAITATGDPALAATLRELAQTTPFWIEQFTSRWLGPVLGQRVAGAGRGVLAFPEQASERVVESVASYMRDETGWLASGEEGRVFEQQNAALAERVAALEQRLEHLLRTVTAIRP
jgi:ubiquinone biosynthesis protein UbiJ